MDLREKSSVGSIFMAPQVSEAVQKVRSLIYFVGESDVDLFCGN